MKTYRISQIVEIEANSQEDAWEIFNQTGRDDDWEIEEV